MTLPAHRAERTICFSRLEKFDEVHFITESRKRISPNTAGTY